MQKRRLEIWIVDKILGLFVLAVFVVVLIGVIFGKRRP
jgi:hypothetical protein